MGGMAEGNWLVTSNMAGTTKVSDTDQKITYLRNCSVFAPKKTNFLQMKIDTPEVVWSERGMGNGFV